MIKLLERDLRTYRKDTFITSFFATITILLIVLIICSVPSHAQEISGGENDDTYSYDTENFVNWLDVYKGIDITKTEPTGVLNLQDNPLYEVDNTNYPGVGIYNKIPTTAYYFQSPNSSFNGVFNGNTIMNIPEFFTYDGIQYQTNSYSNFYFMVWSEGAYCSLIISKSSSLMSCFDSYRKWYQPIGTDSFILYYPNGTTSNPIIKRPVEQRISGHDVDDNVNILNISYYDSLVYTNASATCEMNELKDDNGWYWLETKYNEIELNYLNGQNGNGGSSGSTSETPDNNLVMTNGDWIFKNSKYSAPYDSSFPTGSIYPSGSVSFSFDPTVYQATNPSAFELVFTFYFQYDVDYKNWNQAFSVFEETSQLLNNTKRYSHTYNYNDNGAVEIILPLSDFIENGNSKSWTWQDIFDKLENGAFTSVLNNSRELYSVSYNKFDLTATAYIKSANSKSGNITEWYNPMSKKGYTTDDSGSLNKNPYVPTDSNNNDGNAPGDAGNNGDSVTSSGGVTIYNYNNNNNSGGTLSSDTNNFTNVFNKLIGDNKVTSESIAGSTGVNGFLTFMNNTISSVPILFFTHLLTFFTTCLAILVVAFVLRMLLDIL